jgi:hypothetical protein
MFAETSEKESTEGRAAFSSSWQNTTKSMSVSAKWRSKFLE